MLHKDIQLLHLMQFGEAREAFRDQHSTSFTGHFHLRSGDISFARCLVFGISNWTDKGKDKDFPLRSRDISPVRCVRIGRMEAGSKVTLLGFWRMPG